MQQFDYLVLGVGAVMEVHPRNPNPNRNRNRNRNPNPTLTLTRGFTSVTAPLGLVLGLMSDGYKSACEKSVVIAALPRFASDELSVWQVDCIPVSGVSGEFAYTSANFNFCATATAHMVTLT